MALAAHWEKQTKNQCPQRPVTQSLQRVMNRYPVAVRAARQRLQQVGQRVFFSSEVNSCVIQRLLESSQCNRFARAARWANH